MAVDIFQPPMPQMPFIQYRSGRRTMGKQALQQMGNSMSLLLCYKVELTQQDTTLESLPRHLMMYPRVRSYHSKMMH